MSHGAYLPDSLTHAIQDSEEKDFFYRLIEQLDKLYLSPVSSLKVHTVKILNIVRCWFGCLDW